MEQVLFKRVNKEVWKNLKKFEASLKTNFFKQLRLITIVFGLTLL